jgi:hypothetical protein
VGEIRPILNLGGFSKSKHRCPEETARFDNAPSTGLLPSGWYQAEGHPFSGLLRRFLSRNDTGYAGAGTDPRGIGLICVYLRNRVVQESTNIPTKPEIGRKDLHFLHPNLAKTLKYTHVGQILGGQAPTDNKLSKWKIKRSADFANYADFAAKPALKSA